MSKATVNILIQTPLVSEDPFWDCDSQEKAAESRGNKATRKTRLPKGDGRARELLLNGPGESDARAGGGGQKGTRPPLSPPGQSRRPAARQTQAKELVLIIPDTCSFERRHLPVSCSCAQMGTKVEPHSKNIHVCMCVHRYVHIHIVL